MHPTHIFHPTKKDRTYLLFQIWLKRDKISRLYHENKFLKSKQSEWCDERLDLLQTKYEDEKTRSDDLQHKLIEATNHKIELESKLKARTFAAGKESDETLVSELKAKVSRVHSLYEDELGKNKKLEESIEFLSEYIFWKLRVKLHLNTKKFVILRLRKE